MKKYIVHFTTIDGDYSKEWCYASSKKEAADTVMRDHWDIKKIKLVCKA